MTIKLAVLGNPVAHSLSPLIHHHFAQLLGHDISYERILVEDDFATQVRDFYLAKALGCNVTVPCKLQAYDLATELTERARIAKAVNTLKFMGMEGDKLQVLGDNTDGAGLFLDLQRLNCPLANSKILILGAGGATRGILPDLMRLPAQSICIVNRTVTKGEDIISYLSTQLSSSVNLQVSSYEELTGTYDIIINATSLSLHKELPKIADEIYQQAKFVYDLYYTQEGGTVFTSKAQALGVKHCYDGLGMLVGQAALSYQLWTGVLPDITKTLAYIRSFGRH